jgi:hypothetical protein
VIRRLVCQWFNYGGPGKWSGRAVARRLGISHTYIQKLIREFMADPRSMLRECAISGEATFGHLNRAQEETRQQKEYGLLRSHRRWKWAELKVGDQVVRALVQTKASLERFGQDSFRQCSGKRSDHRFRHGRRRWYRRPRLSLFPIPWAQVQICPFGMD